MTEARSLLVGLSGGADSVALLLLLLEEGRQVTAVHVNHGLRGEESDGDERFVRSLCEAHGVPLLVYRADLSPGASEDACRRARYAFFREAMAQCGADALALAHHRDDQTEAFLLHLLRGAGPAGLGGMSEDATVDGLRILRPLLSRTREELREYLRSRHQPWREDSSNTDTHYLRNAIRRELIPLAEQLAPGAAGRIASAAELVREEHALLLSQADNFLRQHAGIDWIALPPLRAEPETMRRLILRRWWEKTASGREERSLSREQTDLLSALMEGKAGDGCPLPERRSARITRHCLVIEPGFTPQDLREAAPSDGRPCAGLTLHISHQPVPGSECLPRMLLDQCTLRTLRPGDWITPFGQQRRVPINEYLAVRHVEAFFRPRVPLLCRGSEVLLAAGISPGNIPTHQDDPVHVHWEGPMPWKEQGGS